MELWIRSQDKELIQKVNIGIMYLKDATNRDCIANRDNETGFSILGTYRTKERALEVLDEIQNILNLKDMYKYDRELVLKSWENADENQVKIIRQQMSVYEMP